MDNLEANSQSTQPETQNTGGNQSKPKPPKGDSGHNNSGDSGHNNSGDSGPNNPGDSGPLNTTDPEHNNSGSHGNDKPDHRLDKN